MGNRTITVRRPEHPANMAKAIGQQAKEQVRNLSNTELDLYLGKLFESAEDLGDLLEWPRHKKIKFVKDLAIRGFTKEYKAAEKAAKEKTRAEGIARMKAEAEKAEEAKGLKVVNNG